MKPEDRKTAFGTLLMAVLVGILFVIVFFAVRGTGRYRAKGLVTTFRTAALDGDLEEAQSAYEQLKEVGPVAVPFAARLLGDESSQARALGADLVQELIEEIRERRRREGRDDRPADPQVLQVLPDLVRALKDEDDRVRGKAASALGWIGPDAGSALRALEEASGDQVDTVRERAKRAIARIQTGSPSVD